MAAGYWYRGSDAPGTGAKDCQRIDDECKFIGDSFLIGRSNLLKSAIMEQSLMMMCPAFPAVTVPMG